MDTCNWSCVTIMDNVELERNAIDKKWKDRWALGSCKDRLNFARLNGFMKKMYDIKNIANSFDWT